MGFWHRLAQVSLWRPFSFSGSMTDQKIFLVDHLEELRKRLWVCILSILLTSVIGCFLAPQVIQWLKRPAGDALPTLAFFSPPEAMVAYLKVGLGVGIFLSMPVLLYEIWAFVRPGLTSPERRLGLAFVLWGTLLFGGGIAFAYWILLPVSLRFLLTFGGETLKPVISVSQYLSFTLTVALACGLVFQLPIAVFFLTKLGVLSPKLLREKWRVAFLGIVVVAAVITPTQDAVTLVLMTLPLLALYGVSVVVACLAKPGQRRYGNLIGKKGLQKE